MDKQTLQSISEEDLKQYYLEYMRRYRIKNKDRINYNHTKYNKKRTSNRKDITTNRNEDKDKRVIVNNTTSNRNTNNTNNDKSLNNTKQVGSIF